MYKVYFTDNSVFEGGTIHNSKWLDIPNKPIKRIEYTLLTSTIVLEGYEAYNHIVEYTTFLTQGCKRITKILLVGKKGEKVDAIEYDILKKKAFKRTLEAEREYNDRPITGWKVGCLNLRPCIRMKG